MGDQFRESELRRAGHVRVSSLFIRDTTLSVYEKIVYLNMQCFDFGRGNCFPSLKTLEKMSGVDRKTVQRAVNTLTEKGFIKKIPRKSKHGGTMSNDYLFSELEGVYCEKDNPFKLKKAVKESLADRGINVQHITNGPGDDEIKAADKTNAKEKVKKAVARKNAAKNQSKEFNAFAHGLEIAEEYDAQGKAALGRRMKRKDDGVQYVTQSSDPDYVIAAKELTAHDVMVTWRDMAKELFPDVKSTNAFWDTKRMGQAKLLCQTWGAAVVVDAVVHFLTHWKQYKDSYNMKGNPHIGLMLGYQDSIMDNIANGSFKLPMTMEEDIAERMERKKKAVNKAKNKNVRGEHDGKDDPSGAYLL